MLLAIDTMIPKALEYIRLHDDEAPVAPSVIAMVPCGLGAFILRYREKDSSDINLNLKQAGRI